MYDFFRKQSALVSIFLFLIIFIVGISIFDDYGIHVDELAERNTGLITLKYVLNDVLKVPSLPEELLLTQDLLSYKDKDYGVVLQMPTVLFEYFMNFRFDEKTIFKIRHFWLFINFYVATIFFYMFIKKRFQNPFFSIIAVIFLVLSPRIFADAFYNNKDLLFLSWFIISLYFFVQFIYSSTILNGFFLSITIALSSNIRVVGLMILFFSCLFLLIKLIRKKIKFSRFILLACLLIGVTVSLWILFLPASWENPAKYLLNVFKSFSNFDHIEPEVYFGKLVPSDALPWHYILVWIGITTPILYLFLFLIGLVFIVFVGEKKFSEDFFLDICMLSMFLIPIISAILFHSTLYNGWRHLYFIYVPFLYIAIYGFKNLLHSKFHLIKLIIGTVTFLSLTITLIWMIRNHPYQMVYFNFLAREYAENNFEKDYWRLSSSECLKFIVAQDNNLRIDISDYDAVLHVAKYALPIQDRNRLSTTSYGFGGHPSKYVIANYTNTIGNELQFPFYTPIYHITVDQMKIASVFQRDHTDELWSQDMVTASRSNVNDSESHYAYDGDLSTGWTTGKLQNNNDYLDLQFNASYSLDGITFYLGTDDNECPWSLQLFSSEDGISWEPIEITYRGVSDYKFIKTKTKYLRLKNSEPSKEHSWAVYELLFHGTRETD